MIKKYELLTNDTIEINGNTLYRIRALHDFDDVEKGDLGGYIQSEDNLSHEGNCWVYDDAKVYESAIIYGNTKLYDNVEVYGHACISDSVHIRDNVKVYDNSIIHGFVIIQDNAQIFGCASINGKVNILGNSNISHTVCGYVSLVNANINKDRKYCNIILGDISFTVYVDINRNICISGTDYYCRLDKFSIKIPTDKIVYNLAVEASKYLNIS